MEPVEPVIYQSNTYRKDLGWPHFNDGPRVQEKLQKYCKDLLFWGLWAYLIMATKNDGISFKETLILILPLSSQDFATLLLRHFMHARPPTPKQ